MLSSMFHDEIFINRHVQHSNVNLHLHIHSPTSFDKGIPKACFHFFALTLSSKWLINLPSPLKFQIILWATKHFFTCIKSASDRINLKIAFPLESQSYEWIYTTQTFTNTLVHEINCWFKHSLMSVSKKRKSISIEWYINCISLFVF